MLLLIISVMVKKSYGMENKICWIGRDFPSINSTAVYNDTVLDLCESQEVFVGKSCSIRKLEARFLDVFGVVNSGDFRVRAPNSKINCSDTFGEYYVHLSCMGLCLGVNARCLLNDKPLLFNDCPGQYPDRVYTVANNSYLTFARKSDDGYYYPKAYQCKNGRCVEHNQLCDLIDDCGDFSDEVDCMNHQICKNTINESKKHLISIKQQCDGIYDCFDFSDECNDLCGRVILEGFMIKFYCWFVGIFAVILNTLAVVRGFAAIKDCETTGNLMTRTLVSVISHWMWRSSHRNLSHFLVCV